MTTATDLGSTFGDDYHSQATSTVRNGLTTSKVRCNINNSVLLNILCLPRSLISKMTGPFLCRQTKPEPDKMLLTTPIEKPRCNVPFAYIREYNR